MAVKIRTPYFEIGTKNYIYGDQVLEYARAADAAAEKYDIDVQGGGKHKTSDHIGALHGYTEAGQRYGGYFARGAEGGGRAGGGD